MLCTLRVTALLIRKAISKAITRPAMKRIGWVKTPTTKLAMNSSAWMKVLAMARTVEATTHRTTSPIATARPRNRSPLLTNISLFTYSLS
jgi:hypothetical protein